MMVRRFPLVAYFVLAYALTWWVYPLLRFSPLIGLFGLFGPALAAIIVTGITEGRAGVKALVGRTVRWRVPLPWYLVALGLPAALALMAAGLYVLVGPGTSIQLARLSVLDFVLVILVVGEELGWRGYALPKLLAKRSPLIASLIIGVLWGAWHLPTFFISGNTPVQTADRRLPGVDHGVLDPAQLAVPAHRRQRAACDPVPRRHQYLPGLLAGWR